MEATISPLRDLWDGNVLSQSPFLLGQPWSSYETLRTDLVASSNKVCTEHVNVTFDTTNGGVKEIRNHPSPQMRMRFYIDCVMNVRYGQSPWFRLSPAINVVWRCWQPSTRRDSPG
jgi:hypothetical protein